MSVGCYDYIAHRSHELQIPTIAKELAHGALRSALAIKYGRIALGRIKIGRINYPSQHIASIGSTHPTTFYLAELDRGIDILVDVGKGHAFSVAISVQLSSFI